jgi:histidinol dehydrogenase
MPTGGTARFKGPVNVLDFVKVVNIIGVDAATAAELAADADRLARAESLTAHAGAARYRATGSAE